MEFGHLAQVSVIHSLRSQGNEEKTNPVMTRRAAVADRQLSERQTSGRVLASPPTWDRLVGGAAGQEDRWRSRRGQGTTIS
jgi:hypothetical protein